MSRPKPTPEDADAIAARQERYGLSDSDISDEEHARNMRLLTAKLEEQARRDREDRRRLKAGLPRWPGDNGERRT